jgi:hypothetical protein
MASIQKVIMLLFIVILFSCEEHGYFIKCSECITTEPVKVQLEIKLNFNGYSGVGVRIYEGNIEDSLLIAEYDVYAATFKYNVSLNNKYTVTGTYFKNDNKYITVDSATPKTGFDKDRCEKPCYYVYDKVLDIRLKNSH